MVSTIHYEVACSEPHRHLLDLRLTLRGVEAKRVRLAMPVWTPGSYLVREFSRHVQDVEAHDLSGSPVPCTRVDKRCFELEPRGGGVVFSYRIYANELSVRTNHVDDTHAFIAPAATFFAVEGSENQPIELTVRPFDGWSVETPLCRVDGSQDTYEVRDFDHLVDSPIDMGCHQAMDFQVMGLPHRFAVWGRGGYDLERLVRDSAAIVEESAALFGGVLPYERYLFILHSAVGARGGLEHLDSTVLGWSPHRFQPESRYEAFLRLVTHEFFHVWNIKRIRPRELGPFDYSQETYTRMLWLHEGGTVFYEGVIAVRAGVVRTKSWLKELGADIKRLESAPGRLHMSVADSSFNAWIKLYRPDENSGNTTISYYLKGALVCLCLDQWIRERSGDSRSLDDVMRTLFELTNPPNPGYEEEAFCGIVQQATGVDVSEFLVRYVDGVEELPLEHALGYYGLELNRGFKRKGGVDTPRPVWIGIEHEARGGLLRVRSVREGGPAADAGIYAHDELLALDGYKVTSAGLTSRLAAYQPGDRITVTLFRRDELREVELVCAEPLADEYSVRPLEEADEGAKRRFQALLGQSFPGSQPAD